MNKELELWQFIALRLKKGEPVMLLAVGTSSGSSPGRAGYKMAVGADGELIGSIGGGVMEVNLVEQSRAILSEPGLLALLLPEEEWQSRRHLSGLKRWWEATGSRTAAISKQVHQKDSPNASGMICSGRQTIVFRLLTPHSAETVDKIIGALAERNPAFITITPNDLTLTPSKDGTANFEKHSDTDYVYIEKLGPKNDLYIIGGGHCALALSELMSRMDFRISIFDDRPNLNTIEKNRFANEIRIIENYDAMGELIPSGENTYVVVMTLGYKSDETVIRSIFEKDFKYIGVLGSKAKMKTLMKDLEKEGFSKDRLARLRTPIGLSINSRTPEEIAVSIAAEIISIKNS